LLQVYEQVRKLFNNAPDLIDEFKQFLPENGSGNLAAFGFGSFVQAAQGQAPGVVDKPATKRGKDKEPPTKKRRGAGDGKAAAARVSYDPASALTISEIQSSQSRHPIRR
jgi:paired amphipathic helix protein Sin3a